MTGTYLFPGHDLAEFTKTGGRAEVSSGGDFGVLAILFELLVV